MKIKVGEKEYDIPDLDVDHWRAIIEADTKREGEESTLFTVEGVERQIAFYYDLLHPYYNDITKKTLGKMPVYQLSSLFITKILAELMTVPLDSEPEKEKTQVLESSSTEPSSPSPTDSTGPPAKSAK